MTAEFRRGHSTGKAPPLHERSRENLSLAERRSAYAFARLAWREVFERYVTAASAHGVGQIRETRPRRLDRLDDDLALEAGLFRQSAIDLRARHIAGSRQCALHDLVAILAKSLDAVIEAVEAIDINPAYAEYRHRLNLSGNASALRSA